MLKHWCFWLFVLVIGIVGLALAAIAASGKGPGWFTNLDVAIASVSGVLVGGALGPLLVRFVLERLLKASGAVMALGLLYIFLAAIERLLGLRIDLLLDVYFAAGSAISGSALSIMLAHRRS